MGIRKYPSPKERWFSKVRKLENGCWAWQGSYFEHGRPAFWLNGHLKNACRAGWELLRGPIPEGKILCHYCNNRWCVNPDHVYPGDHASNAMDRTAAGHTSRWSHRYNFVQTPELEKRVREMRHSGMRIEDICSQLDIGRTTYYRLRARDVIGADRDIARANYRQAALRRS